MSLEDYLAQHYRASATEGYLGLIRRFRLSLGERAEGATYSDVLDYIGQLRDAQLHPKTVRNHLFAIKIYFRYLVVTGKRKDHPCRYLYLKDQVNRAIPIESLYTKEALQTFYEQYQSKSPQHQRRNKIIISLLIYQALTCQEIRQLRPADLDLKAATLFIRATGKNQARRLGLQAQQVLLLHDYLTDDYKHYQKQQPRGHRADRLLLSRYGRALRKGGVHEVLNVRRPAEERLIPLKVRQSVIAHLLRSGHDLRVVQAFAGHRRAASTEAYRQTGLEELKAAINQHHPLG